MKPLPAAAATPKPVVSSSPGRPEKLPAPGLARLLRGKSAGRSRARSAASPMFVSRSKSVGRSSSSTDPALPDAGDPSSPKVTCIGQVRIRNRNRNNRKKSSRSADPYRFQCLRRLFPCRTKKCYSPYRFLSCWKKQKKNAKETADANEAAPPIAFVREFKIESDLEEEEEEEAGDEETRVFVSSSSAAAADATAHSLEDAAPPPPPKNALLLMRCRSAPHNRPSALALSRFPVSPVPASETEEEEQIEKSVEEMVGERGRESCNGSAKDEEDSRSSSASQAPAGLMRCKSEPAKKAERLMKVSYGSGKGGMGVVQEMGPTLSPPPPPPPPILLH